MITHKTIIDQKILYFPHISEKSSNIEKRYNTVIFKVAKNATKKAIKKAIKNIFNVEVIMVNTLQVKGKVKHHIISRKSTAIQSHQRNWKKAYISLKSGQKINLINNSSTIE
ncbi:MAG: 50S ribosomal protein L23 [Candidatus Dasytiphilus stammeri]